MSNPPTLLVFHAHATYVTPAGRMGRWEGRVLSSWETVHDQVEQLLRKRRRIGGKLDIYAVPV